MTEKKRMKMYEQANALIFNYPGQLTLEQTKYLNTRCCETYTAAHNDATAIIERLEKHLEFYADGEGDVLDWDRVNKPACIQDRGEKAREALAELNKWRNE